MSTDDSISLDVDLYNEFKKYYFDDYEYLAPDIESNEKNKSDFLNGRIENPTFSYLKLNTFDFQKITNGFNHLKQQITRYKNKTIKAAYSARIEEMLAQVKMLYAAKNNQDKEFFKYSKIVYGKPSMEIFEFDKVKLMLVIKSAYSSKNFDRINAANNLKNLIYDWSIDKSVEAEFNLLPMKTKDNGKILNATQIKSMFDKALQDLNINNWQVKIDQTGERSNLSANQEKRLINIPNDKNLNSRSIKTTSTNIRALIAHELTHAKRRENGEKSKLKLLGLGLDRFLKGEEGLASYEYQQIEGAADFAAFRSHFSISLAIGLDGKVRNFREVFEILKFYLIASSEDGINQSNIKQFDTIAWNTCIRCFRGTSCSTPGAVYTKGHIYREGNIGIYKLIASRSKEVDRFMVGKYDPTNHRHIKILNHLSI